MRGWQTTRRDYSVHFQTEHEHAMHGTSHGNGPATFDLIPGGPGNDDLLGTSGDDTFDLTEGGDDHASGLEGNDTFSMGATLTGTDGLDGGDGYDTVSLDGDYSAGVVLRSTTLAGIEQFTLAAGHSYALTAHDSGIIGALTMTIDGSALGATDNLGWDGHKENDGSFLVMAGAGDDILTGGNSVDDLRGAGGKDTLCGRLGNDSLDGGNGNDTVTYAYDSGGVSVDLFGGTATESGASVDSLFNIENIIGGAGNDTLTDSIANNTISGGDGNDHLQLFHGGADTGKGGAGDDTIVMDKALSVSDRLIGGDGYDTINLGETAAIVLGAKTISGIEEIVLSGGWSYDIATNDRNIARNTTLKVTATSLGTGDSAHFNGGAERNGSFEFDGGHGHDVFTGGKKADVLMGGEGADTLIGGLGGDTFKYTGVSDSYHSSFDDITDFDAASDAIDLWFAISAVDAGVSCETLDDLSGAADAAHFGAGHALVATVGADTFLVIDANAADGYQVGEDLLVRINGAINMGDLTAADFI